MARPKARAKARPKSRQFRSTANVRRTLRSQSAKASRQSRAIGQQAATLSGEVARIGADVIELNTGALQDVWRSGIELAADASRQSLHQFAGMLQNGRAEQASNFSAIAKRIERAAPRETLTRLPAEMFELTEDFAAQQRSWFEQFGSLGKPQDLIGLQGEMMRFNMLRFLGNLRTFANLWEKLARQTAEQLGRTSERIARIG
jgi:hypothetical protein